MTERSAALERARRPSPECESCGSPCLAWQIAQRCVLWRCPRCGHIGRDVELAPPGRAEEYGGDSRADSVRRALTLRRIRAAIGAHPRPVRRILDVGCGDGALARDLAAAGFELVGVDVHVTGAQDQSVTLINGRLEDVDLGIGTFDAVVAIHVLEHVDDLDETLRRLAGLLVPGGLLYAITPAADSAALRTFRDHWWMLEDPTHVRFLSSVSAKRLCERAGFADVHVRPLTSDSLMATSASLARSMGLGDPGRGALSGTLGRVVALAGIAPTLVVRAVRPRWCDSIEITAEAPR